MNSANFGETAPALVRRDMILRDVDHVWHVIGVED
jgi:hypothetical protein